MIRLRVKSAKGGSTPKRSSRACAACRCRKVRCDVTTPGLPCTSCYFYDVACIVLPDRRRRSGKEAKQSREEETSSHVSLGDVSNTPAPCEADMSPIPTDRDPPFWIEASRKSVAASETALFSTTRPVRWDTWLPNYASPLSPSITRQTCKFLHEKGAFDVPDTRVRDGLLRSYVQFIHPAIPVIDLEAFLVVIDGSYQGDAGVSFLLFQAIMFAASAFETFESVASERYKTRQEVRKARFEKVQLLYSLGCEDDRVAILQAVLLMTYWDNSCEDWSCATYYVGVAKAILESIQTNPTEAETRMIQEQPGLWRRIQWSYYIRDRLVALTMLHPYQLDESKFQISMLSLADFELGPLSTKSCLGTDGTHPAIRDPFVRELLSQISICLARLCRCISRILPCQQNATHVESESPAKYSSSAEILLRDSELRGWANSLPDLLQWSPSNPGHGINKHKDVVIPFAAMLTGMYNLACCALHQPRLASNNAQLPEILELSKRRVDHAVSEVTEIFRFFRSNRSSCVLPDGQVVMLETVIAVHLDNLRSPHPETRQLAIENFQLCAELLQQISDTYPSADTALARVEMDVRQDDSLEKRAEYQPHEIVTRDTGPRVETANSFPLRSSKNYDQSALSQKIDSLDIAEVNALLSSHFMMTSSERTFLQSLASPAGTISDSASEGIFDHSSASKSPESAWNFPTHDMNECPDYLPLYSDWFLEWNGEMNTSPKSKPECTEFGLSAKTVDTQ